MRYYMQLDDTHNFGVLSKVFYRAEYMNQVCSLENVWCHLKDGFVVGKG